METKVKLSTLWIVIMINMVFADILSFMIELSTGNVTELANVEELMLVAAIITQVPIMMIFLSRSLKYRLNRILNIFAGLFTILYVTAGGSAELHYIFIAFVEVICALAIILTALSWKEG